MKIQRLAQEHDEECQCPTCDGIAQLERAVPLDCLFDGDEPRGHREAKQNRWKD